MANLTDYIECYGAWSFCIKPFNEVDNLIFSQLAYVDFDGIVPSFDSEGGISLREACEKYFQKYTEKELKRKISIVYKAALLLKQCAAAARFGNVLLKKYVNNINSKIDKQFSALNFYLEDETAVIAFRGTDVSVAGVKESAMLSYMFPVPAQIEALYYFQETASAAERPVRVCGHSKGGNLAVFAAVSCSNSLKKNIIGVYENDAPGFPAEMIHRYDYVQMKEKIYAFIPESSIIGCMLEHNENAKIVKSVNSGIRQHQVSSWQVEEDHFVSVPQRDKTSLFIDKYLKQLVQEIGSEAIEKLFETVFDVFADAGITSFDEIKHIELSRFLKAIDSIKEIDETQRKVITEIVRTAVKEFSKQVYTDKIRQRRFNGNEP